MLIRFQNSLQIAIVTYLSAWLLIFTSGAEPMALAGMLDSDGAWSEEE